MKFRHQAWIPLLGLLGAAVILLVSALAADRVRQQTSQFASAQIETHLRSLARSIDNVHADRLRLARAVAERARVAGLVRRILDREGSEEAAEALDRQLMDELPKLGLSGYEVYDENYFIVAASNPGLVGTRASPQPHQLERLRRSGTVVTPPLGPADEEGSPVNDRASGFSELICSEVRPKGLLCLAADPRALLLPLLDSGLVGESGEAYLIDRQGRLRTPSRFENVLPPAAEGHNPRLLSRAYARVPPQPSEKGSVRLPGADDPLTEVAAALIASPDQPTGVIEDYLDYRRERVVGAGIWLVQADLGLLLEVDADEVHASSDLAALWVWGLGVVAAAILLLLSGTHARSRKALALSEASLRGFLQNAPVGMDIQTVDGRFLRFNRTMQEFFGVNLEQVEGRREDEVPQFEPRLIAERREQRRQVLATRKPLFVSKQVKDHAGEVHHAKVVNFPLFAPDSDEVLGMGTVATDITEQVQAQEALHALASRLEKEVESRTRELREARDAAERAGEAKANFLASMSHEIRTPLNAISGMAHLAKRRNATPAIDRYLERLLASTQHLLGIVNDVLDFSALEANKLSPESTVFSPEELVLEVAALIGERATVKGLDMLLDVEPEVPAQVVGDAKRIRQILINFSANAVKFTSQGFVRVRIARTAVRKDRASLLFCVEDTGAGIEAGELARLFQPFEQLRGPGRSSQEGTGLGLAISKRLAEAMEGRVFAESEPGRGSRFCLELSLAVVEESHAEQLALVRGLGPVLVVDHHAESARTTVAHLARLGLQADQVASSEEALARLTAQAEGSDAWRYGLVLIDEMMPALDGPGLSRRIQGLRWSSSKPRMLLVSPPGMLGQDGRDDCDAWVSKPLSVRQLHAALESLEASSDTAHPHSARTQPDPADLAGVRVLLVEDNQVNREVAGDLLRLEGVIVEEAHDGREALGALRERRFDAVLMDINMPVMDGVAATRAIRADAALRGTTIIGLSASVLAGDRDACLAAGMDDFLGKPLVPTQLFDALRRWTRRDTDGSRSSAPVRSASTDPAAPEAKRLESLRRIRALDVDAALGRLEGHAGLYLRLVDRVVADGRMQGRPLLEAVEARDRESAVRLAHNMASLAGSLGATTLRERCLAIEQSLHSGEWDDRAVAELAADCATLWDALQHA